MWRRVLIQLTAKTFFRDSFLWGIPGRHPIEILIDFQTNYNYHGLMRQGIAATKSKKFVYLFEEADETNKKLLGGKGAGLAEMTRMGLPVPPGFTVSIEACIQYYQNKKRLPMGLMEEVQTSLKKVEEKTGRVFGSSQNPLFFSVRSGAAMSMPGMMDTILNLGLNSETLKGLIQITSAGRFAYDVYRRFIQ